MQKLTKQSDWIKKNYPQAAGDIAAAAVNNFLYDTYGISADEHGGFIQYNFDKTQPLAIDDDNFAITAVPQSVFRVGINRLKKNYNLNYTVQHKRPIADIAISLATHNADSRAYMNNRFQALFRNIVQQKKQQNQKPQPDRGAFYADATHTTINPGALCCVHTTRISPHKQSDGNYHINNYAVDVGNLPRATVHFSFNFVVMGHSGGDWTEMHTTILAPFTEMLEQNGKPLEMSAIDTFWSTNPETGIILPRSFRIVQGDKNLKKLIVHAPNKTLYKTGNFTDADKEYLARQSLYPEDTDKWYATTNKELAINATLNKMGFTHFFYEDTSRGWQQIQNTAKMLGIKDSANQYAHSIHPTSALENLYEQKIEALMCYEQILLHHARPEISANSIALGQKYFNLAHIRDLFGHFDDFIDRINNTDLTQFDDNIKQTYTYWTNKITVRIKRVANAMQRYKTFDEFLNAAKNGLAQDNTVNVLAQHKTKSI